MKYLEETKKHAGWLIIPFFWIAYFIDYGVSHIHDRTLEAIPNHDIVFATKTVVTIFVVLIALYLIFEFLVWFTTKIESNLPYVLLAVCLLCFGMIGPFKELDIVPFKNINLFWHLASLATAFWLFDFFERITKYQAELNG